MQLIINSSRGPTETMSSAITFDGYFNNCGARILLDPLQACSTISEDFSLTYRLGETYEQEVGMGFFSVERFVSGSLTVPTTSGRYVSAWRFTIRRIHHHDICLGADWIDACRVRTEAETILDPFPEDVFAYPPQLCWFAQVLFYQILYAVGFYAEGQSTANRDRSQVIECYEGYSRSRCVSRSVSESLHNRGCSSCTIPIASCSGNTVWRIVYFRRHVY